MHSIRFAAFLSAASALTAQVQHTVVPAANASQDAVAFQWIAGASRDVRQQTLIGQSHLQSVVGRVITALELRRTAVAEAYTGGIAALNVTLSTSPRLPLTTSPTFQQNHGIDAALVFQGFVALPGSPATTGSSVPWDAANVVRIQFDTPFLYQGGTMCIDVVGNAVAGQTADWWMADAEFEDLAGTKTEIGTGCGTFGGSNGRWSFVNTRSLLVGAPAHFWANGPANGFAVAVFGEGTTNGIPLSQLGLDAPGCMCHVLPNAIVAAELALFAPDPDPRLAGRGGVADLRFQIPNLPSSLNLTMTTQWLELSGPATSNAIRWTVCGTAPSIDMALVEGHPSMADGNVNVHLAHVWRIEHL
jgi:hypothetical protein